MKFRVKIINDDYRKPSGNLRIGRKITVKGVTKDVSPTVIVIHQSVSGTRIENPYGGVMLTPDEATSVAQTMLYASKIARGNAPYWLSYVDREIRRRGGFMKPKRRNLGKFVGKGNKVYAQLGTTCA